MVKPTIAIGMGKAGCRMVNSLSEVAEREDEASQFELITIDTNEDDLFQYNPQDGQPFPLSEPGEFWEQHRREFSYLREDFRLPTGQGTVRQRAVSRYHIDNSENFEDLREFLEGRIDDFVNERVSAIDDEEVADVNVWLLNSLGGGTGSGAFPIMSALIKRITDAMEYDFYLGGIGSLPRLDGLEEKIQVPTGNADFYVNAYAALRELSKLVNYDNDPQRYPIELSLEAEHPNIPGSKLRINENPFDMYWLLGFKEGEDSRSYRQHMNAVAANGIYFHAAMDSPENFPDDDSIGNHTLYAIDASEIRAPAEEANRYVELQQEIRDIETEIDDIKRVVSRLEEDIAYLNELRQLTLDYKELQTETDYIDTEVLRESRNLVNNFEPHSVTERDTDIDDHIDTLLRRLENQLRDGEFDSRSVITLIYCEQFLTRLNEIVAGHRFNEKVDAVWDSHREELREEYPYLDDDEPIDKWENGLEDWLYEKGRELKQEAESITFNRLRKRRLENQVDQLGQQVKTIEEYYKEFEQLRNLRTESESRVESARQDILNTKQDLERRVEDRREARREQESNLENKKGQRERRKNQLQKNRKIAGEFILPLRDLSNITQEIVENSDSIADYIENGKIEETIVAKTMRQCIQSIQDPVQDVPRDDSIDTKSVLGVMTNEENINRSDGNLLNLSVPNKMDIPSQINAKFDYYSEDENLVNLRNGFSIWFLALYTNLGLVNTSEYGTIHEYYDDPNRKVSEQLGEGYSDEEVTLKFAYPELFPDDERIQSAFGSE